MSNKRQSIREQLADLGERLNATVSHAAQVQAMTRKILGNPLAFDVVCKIADLQDARGFAWDEGGDDAAIIEACSALHAILEGDS